MYELAVIGNPIEHSLSPQVFTLFAEQSNIKLNYSKILCQNKELFHKTVNVFFTNGGHGLNITSPFKHEAYQCAKYHTSRAEFCMASNFLKLNTDGKIIADTTDGIGLLKDLANNQQLIFNKKILIIGSGFVLDSLMLDLIVKNPKQIAILARNQEKIKYLQNKFGCQKFDNQIAYDIIINTSPNTRDNQLFSQIITLNNATFCYDLAYNTPITLFLQYMQQLNHNIIVKNGLGMLVEQAKVAFEQLFNKTPDTNIVIKKLNGSGYK